MSSVGGCFGSNLSPNQRPSAGSPDCESSAEARQECICSRSCRSQGSATGCLGCIEKFRWWTGGSSHQKGQAWWSEVWCLWPIICGLSAWNFNKPVEFIYALYIFDNILYSKYYTALYWIVVWWQPPWWKPSKYWHMAYAICHLHFQTIRLYDICRYVSACMQ